MIIYNYLFYAGYKLAEKINLTPIVSGVGFVASCLVLNLLSIYFFINSYFNIDFDKYFEFTKTKNVLLALLITLSLFIYYSFNQKYLKIIKKIDKKKYKHPVLIIVIYFLFSIILFFGLDYV